MEFLTSSELEILLWELSIQLQLRIVFLSSHRISQYVLNAILASNWPITPLVIFALKVSMSSTIPVKYVPFSVEHASITLV